jgi:hypothetical protein
MFKRKNAAKRVRHARTKVNRTLECTSLDWSTFYLIETMERETGIEPATSSLGSWRSTAELLPPTTAEGIESRTSQRLPPCDIEGNRIRRIAIPYGW